MPKKFSVLDARMRLAISEKEKSSTAVPISVLNTAELVAFMVSEFDGLLESVSYY